MLSALGGTRVNVAFLQPYVKRTRSHVPPGPTYTNPVTHRMTRRGLLGAGATSLAALASSRTYLPGHGKNTVMQTQATTTSAPRKVERVLATTSEHWVGDGFRVRSVIAPDGDPRVQSPFLLLDHAPLRRFDPANVRRGVGEHPHRGFETVTFAYRGEIEHRDSSGGGGLIGPGDVQWMTAASGVVHEEMHSRRFTQQGGDMEMVQLWVNLPAKSKMSQPGYQSLLGKDFPRLSLGAAEARLIAGSLESLRGPAHTHTPITIFDLTFGADGNAQFELPSGYNSLVFALEGDLHVGTDAKRVTPGQLAVLERSGSGPVQLKAASGARALVLSGEPIDEPVAPYGPFVMNTRAELVQAMEDYRSGKLGHLE
jgi:redox-sensitive bicupin YhaK (pirin superfamily)